LAALGAALLAVTFAVSLPASLSGATKTPGSANENAHTLVLALPGPFNACPYLDARADQVDDAILDLILPSAFQTQANGTLVGEDGPIASAELTSLTPETVRYTIAPDQAWSDGTPFTGADLVAWWHQAKELASVNSDGYRDIKSLKLSKDALTVTAVFSTPYADWELLFRDVEEPGASPGCAVAELAARASLGPYQVANATADRVVLVMNRAWPLDPNRFGRVVITDATTLPRASTTLYASYTSSVDRAAVQEVSTLPTLQGRIASSSSIEEMTFSPGRPYTSVLGVREALSWSVTRQPMIDQLFGAVTYSPSIAASAVFSQGQSEYPGGGGTGPVNQTTTTTVPDVATNGLADCLACALDVLHQSGYTRTAAGWVSSAGAALRVVMAVGPSDLDHSVAHIVEKDWAAIGVSSASVAEPTEQLAALATATAHADVAVFSRPTLTAPSYAARSWAGPAYPDTYPSGVRSSVVTTLFDQAIANFNPVTASATWLKLDQAIMDGFWVRPLFTPPSLDVWSASISTVANTYSVAGFVDQLPTWTVLPVASTGS
jgi:peptide/nickel transport system substrate-binding protein